MKRNMKQNTRYKRTLILGTMLLCCSLTACTEKKSENSAEGTTQKETFASVANASVYDMEFPEGKEVVTDYTKFVAPKESQEYNFDTDYQFYSIGDGVVKTKQGYVADMNMIHVFDPETREKIYMCAQPQCTHQKSSCDAFAMTFNNRGYMNGYIYNITFDFQDEEYSKLDVSRVSEDGQVKEHVATLANVTFGKYDPDTEGVTCIFHRGYIYYVYAIGSGTSVPHCYKNYSHCLYRLALDGKSEPEFLMKLECERELGNLDSIYLSAFGSYVYFCMSDSAAFGELYRYNIESDQIEKMNIGTIAAETYTVWDGCIVYKKHYADKILYKYNPMDNTEVVFADMTGMAEGDSWALFRDSAHVYVYYTNAETKEAFYVFVNPDGSYAGRVLVSDSFEENGWPGEMLGGDEIFMFEENGTYRSLYGDKSQLNPEKDLELTEMK